MKYLIVVLLSFIIYTLQELKLFNTPQLIEKIKQLNQDNESIPYQIANFGSIPYGRKIIGELKLSQPFDGCDGVEKKSTFILIDRGNCTFVQKVYNSQISGNKVAIIMDDKQRNQDIQMIDDGFGQRVKIPSIFIQNKYGEIFKDYLQKNQGYIQLVLEFQENKYTKTLFKFFINIPSKESNKLIYEFNQVRNKLTGNEVVFEPIYDIYQCNSCKKQDFTNEVPDCILNGRYCTNDPDIYNNSYDLSSQFLYNGKDLVEEIVRQLCLYNQKEDLWWQYNIIFSQDCDQPQLYKECSQKIVKQIQADENLLQQCFQNNTQKKESPILQRQIDILQQVKIFIWPSVIINDLIYRGNLDGEDILEAICASFEEAKGECRYVLDPTLEEKVVTTSNLWIIICYICAGFVVLFLISVFLYKKVVQKELRQGMSQQVSQMVSKYIAFYEQKGKKIQDDDY
ncbi:vacuolar sorting receptor, putative [Ichthyophthirius multifiliis]|uniref:Vacuolar sorting receptor, putative n=1 Tax=Ichthyophthirius multifiliis TaxID=5932 RepID=G0QL98_ICHMU|nr:vacuolar sorting receptor, putative [Ichthyophthirius multifiliis]EGR34007.1 vacuolar sorting receptor, putative [Ichthyophthirius multifiliis]|eukprot:XP_004039311.1 vacuolar sorting receptor, putative [Ichthyophthirius multifiliis]